MKRRILLIICTILSFFIIGSVFSSWSIYHSIEGKTSVINKRYVAYISDSTGAPIDTKKYTSIEKALEVAVSGNVVNVYLNTSTTDPTIITRDCEIKSGVTLNISNKVHSSNSEWLFMQEKTDGKMVSTMTDKGIDNAKVTNIVKVASNVKITNNGTLIICGVLSGGSGGSAYTGQTSREYAKLVLGANSAINSQGTIICCGYIEEEEKNNGSLITITEGTLEMPFIVRDFRGGKQTQAIVGISGSGDGRYLTPFNQFELRNVHCKYRIQYNGELISYGNIYVAQHNATNINLIGNSSSFFFQMTYSGGFVDIKYDKDSEIMDFDFYGGAIFNNLNVGVKISFLSINISLKNVFFPFSWRMNVSLYKAPLQDNEAEFNAKDQKIKLLPGAKLTIHEGAKLIVPQMSVYSYFSDEGSYAGTAYPSKDPAEFYVYGKFTCSGNFGGRIIYGSNIDINSDISTTSNSITTHEGHTIDVSGTLGNIEKTQLISESKNLVSYEDFINKKKLVVGVVKLGTGTNTTSVSNPTYAMNIAGQVSGSLISHNIIMSLDEGTKLLPDLRTNIQSAYFNGVYYVKSTEITFNDSTVFKINASTSEVGDIKISGITISGGNEIPVDTTSQLTATATNANAAYTKTFVWESDNEEVASVDSNGVVTGISVGDANIYAISNDGDQVRSNAYAISVIDPNAKIEIKSVTLKSDKEESDPETSFTATITATTNPDNYTPDLYIIEWTYEAGLTYVSGQGTKILKVTVPACSTNNGSNEYKVSVKFISTNPDYSDVSSSNEITLIAKGPACLLPDTLITLSSGEKVPVEDIESGDDLLVFNHEIGKLDVAPVLFNDSEEEAEYTVINLEFSNGKEVGVVSEHGFFDLDLMKYVYIDEFNYSEFIGHDFYSIDESNNKVITTLDKAYLSKEVTKVYSPVTEYHLNYFTEDILSMPGGVEGLFNIFDYSESLKYDEEAKQRDIEKYGLFTYEDFKDLVPLEMFNAFPTPYLKVAIGKGLLTWEDLYYYIERYGPLM